MSLTFELLKTEGKARRGRMTLNHGVVETPIFMPVGTYGTVKAMTPMELETMQAQIIVAASGVGRDREARRAAPLHELE